MRDIKFRFWDGQETMTDWKTIKQTAFNRDEFALMYRAFTNPDWVLMQYTGVKDKHNKDIYEGDILKESEHGIFEVTWDSYWAKFKLDCKRTSKHIQYPEWNRGMNMEIIGNIYENPELINEK